MLSDSYTRHKNAYLTTLFHEQVKKLSPTIVFIFGGPGTQKGKYIEYMIDHYGFYCISISSVLQEQLGDIRLFEMRGFDTETSIYTVLQWFSKKIDKNKDVLGLIIDIVPNVKVTIPPT